MTTSSPVGRCSDFSQSSRGKLVNRLLIASLALSTISFGLSMGRFGFSSVLVIPSVFGATLIHHITIWCLLAKYKKRSTIPQCPTPPLLKHAGHIWPLALFSLTWFAGGITAICITTMYYFYDYQGYTLTPLDIIDIISASFAFLEGVTLIALLVVCWRALSREGYSGIECGCGSTHVAGDAMGIAMNSLTHDTSNVAPAYEAGDLSDVDSLRKVPI